jgi:two-component system, sensor histidine kinase and response regulator
MTKVLIIEDENSLRQEIAEILSFEGYKVLQAEHGAIGLKKAIAELPDLILCDVMMPEMDGYEVLTRLRQNPAIQLTPFILITALAEREHMRTGMDMGADDYIIKPFKSVELLNAVKSRLTKSDTAKSHAETSLDELRTQIIRSLPHELRTPLNGIIGFGQLLQNHPENYSYEEIAEFGTNIYNSGMRLYRLIQNYLLYTQLEMKKGTTAPRLELHDAHKLCKTMAEEVAKRYERQNDLRLQIDEGSAFIGTQEFKKVVEELCDNAFKFSEPGSDVFVLCGTENDTFFLAVSDNGRGMTSENINKIGAYMQFNRQEYEQQGSGLGLVICQRIIELYDGKISFESKVGESTLVKVILPGKEKNDDH